MPDGVAAERVCRSTPDKPVHCAPHALRAASSRIPWAELLKRVDDVDALACPCGGRLEFISLILEPEVAREILQSRRWQILHHQAGQVHLRLHLHTWHRKRGGPEGEVVGRTHAIHDLARGGLCKGFKVGVSSETVKYVYYFVEPG